MTFNKMLFASAAAFLIAGSAPALAQSALKVGAKVTGPQGGEVGTITAIADGHLTIQTDKHQARIPVASVTATDEQVLFGLSRDQLNSQIDAALAQSQAALSVGAQVHGRDGAVIGAIESVDAETVTVKVGEQAVRLPKTSVAASDKGLVIGATLAEVQAQLSAATTSDGQ